MASYNKIVAFVMVIALLIIVVVCFVIGGFPISINYNTNRANEKTIATNTITSQNSPVALLETTNFDKALLIIDYNDIILLPKSIPHRRVLWSSDSVIVRGIKHSSWTKTEGDMCTTDSKILFFYNNQLIKEYGIVLEPNVVGLQSEEFGWIESIKSDSLIFLLSKFKPLRNVWLNI